jgi:hypothetical protein
MLNGSGYLFEVAYIISFLCDSTPYLQLGIGLTDGFCVTFRLQFCVIRRRWTHVECRCRCKLENTLSLVW